MIRIGCYESQAHKHTGTHFHYLWNQKLDFGCCNVQSGTLSERCQRCLAMSDAYIIPHIPPSRLGKKNHFWMAKLLNLLYKKEEEEEAIQNALLPHMRKITTCRKIVSCSTTKKKEKDVLRRWQLRGRLSSGHSGRRHSACSAQRTTRIRCHFLSTSNAAYK